MPHQKTRTLFSGDLVFRERLPVLDGSLKGWLAWLQAASGRSYDRVVPDMVHWMQICRPEMRRTEQGDPEALLKGTRDAIAKGIFIEDAKHSVSLWRRSRAGNSPSGSTR